MRRVRSIFLAVCVLFTVRQASAQIQQAWVARYNNDMSGGTNQPVKMALDSIGNVYVTGFSENTNTNLGYVTLKVAPNGNQVWAQRFDSTNYPKATPSGAVLDNSNNFIVTGNAVTLKYDSNGNLFWNAPYNAAAVAVDLGNNVYITGVTNGFSTMKLSPSGSNLWTVTDSGIYSGPDNFSLAIAVDSFGNSVVVGNEMVAPADQGFNDTVAVVKYSSTGAFLWRDRMSGSPVFLNENITLVTAVTFDTQSNIYVAVDSPGQIDYRTFKFASDGTLLWWQVDPTGDAYSYSYGFALDSAGNAILTGENANDYPSTCYGTYKLSVSGAYLWTNLYPEAPTNVSTAYAVTTDLANNIYVTGYSPGANGFNDIVTIKYNSNGGQVWLERYSSPVAGNAAGNAIAVDSSGNVYVAGYDTGPGGGTEMVVIKYSPITLQILSNGTVQLQAQGAAGELFDVQATSDLQNWQDLGQSAADTNGLFQFDDTNAPQYPARFYTTIPQ